MVTARVSLKVAAFVGAAVGGIMPMAASQSADEISARPVLPVLGAPVTPDQLYLGKRFNFLNSELRAEHFLADDRFNYVPELDTMTVQSAK